MRIGLLLCGRWQTSAQAMHLLLKSDINQTLNMWIADQQKAGKQGRDDSIKQFSIQPHPSYISFHSPLYISLTMERYVGWSCVLNCFMLSSLLCFPALCQSAIPTFLMFFLVL